MQASNAALRERQANEEALQKYGREREAAARAAHAAKSDAEVKVVLARKLLMQCWWHKV